jgi:signal transduction histidine kinase
LRDVGTHPESYGFPLAHPPMTTFLGVPIVIDGQGWGNLYLTEKAGGGEFTADDEEAVVVLADWAAIAIGNARLYRAVRERRDELERAMRVLETTTEVSRALGGLTDLDRVLELVVKRSRALLDARAAEIALVEGDEFVMAAVAGEGMEGLKGTRVLLEDSLAVSALRTGRVQRFERVPASTFAARVLGAQSAIVAPVTFRNRTVGFLIVFDRLHGGRPFGEEDERLLQAFAATAGTAVATAQNASEEAWRRSIEASEAERTRWARELHDETLQQLAGLRVLLSGARRSGDPARIGGAIESALEQITTAIGDLRALITDLRPAALDEIGTKPALETLVSRVARQTDLEIDLKVDLAYENGDTEFRHVPEVESTMYRLVQEALNNVIKHAGATRVEVHVSDRDGGITLIVRDDGNGFDPGRGSAGFGLVGMRERLALVKGELNVDSSPGAGTLVRASIPGRRRAGRNAAARHVA